MLSAGFCYEIRVLIFSYLAPKDLARLEQVCKNLVPEETWRESYRGQIPHILWPKQPDCWKRAYRVTISLYVPTILSHHLMDPKLCYEKAVRRNNFSLVLYYKQQYEYEIAFLIEMGRLAAELGLWDMFNTIFADAILAGQPFFNNKPWRTSFLMHALRGGHPNMIKFCFPKLNYAILNNQVIKSGYLDWMMKSDNIGLGVGMSGNQYLIEDFLRSNMNNPVALQAVVCGLIRTGASALINFPTWYLNPPIFETVFTEACTYGQYEIMKWIISRQCPGTNYFTLDNLHHAIRSGSQPCVDLIISGLGDLLSYDVAIDCWAVCLQSKEIVIVCYCYNVCDYYRRQVEPLIQPIDMLKTMKSLLIQHEHENKWTILHECIQRLMDDC